jgi:hypothetical protein
MLNAMRVFGPVALVCVVLVGGAAHAQTADPAAAPPTPATTAPPAHASTYSVQKDGELVVAPGLRIPNGNVPWALDVVDGKQVLVPIHHAALTSSSSSMGVLDGFVLCSQYGSHGKYGRCWTRDAYGMGLGFGGCRGIDADDCAG